MEFSDLGEHCSYCDHQDYLPIYCNYCKKYFCKEHSSYNSHNCQEFKKKNLYRPKSEPQSSIYTESCTYNNCKKKEIIRFECSKCKKNFCMSHRLQESHKCGINLIANRHTVPIIKKRNVSNISANNSSNFTEVNLDNKFGHEINKPDKKPEGKCPCGSGSCNII